MVTAKCNRCLGSATGSTFAEASEKINHAAGLSRGIPCGANYNKVIQVGGTPKTKAKKSTPKPAVEKSATPVSEDTKE